MQGLYKGFQKVWILLANPGHDFGFVELTCDTIFIKSLNLIHLVLQFSKYKLNYDIICDTLKQLPL